MTDKNEQFCCPETNELNDQQVIRYLREHPGFLSVMQAISSK